MLWPRALRLLIVRRLPAKRTAPGKKPIIAVQILEINAPDPSSYAVSPLRERLQGRIEMDRLPRWQTARLGARLWPSRSRKCLSEFRNRFDPLIAAVKSTDIFVPHHLSRTSAGRRAGTAL
jgi:hypothetical protein